MTRIDSRVERKKETKNLEEKSALSLNKMYYWIIAFLFFILFALVLFIFSRSGDQVNLTDEEAETEEIQEKTNNDEATSEVVDSNEKEEEKQEDDEEETESSDKNEEDESQVNENAPLDTSHEVNYNDGSADRVAIKKEVMKVTGLGDDLTEYWVGNNGPGRVSATVANPDQSKIYKVELQYGDDQWHVTSYEPLDSLPNN